MTLDEAPRAHLCTFALMLIDKSQVQSKAARRNISAGGQEGCSMETCSTRISGVGPHGDAGDRNQDAWSSR